MTSDLPAAPVPSSAGYSEDAGIHTHPVPPSVRVVLVVFSIVLLLLGWGAVTTYVQGQKRDADQVERVRQQVFAELDRRSAARDAKDAAAQLATRRVVCEVLASDLNPTPTVQQLQFNLGCFG